MFPVRSKYSIKKTDNFNFSNNLTILTGEARLMNPPVHIYFFL